jgi:hypothetical protein
MSLGLTALLGFAAGCETEKSTGTITIEGSGSLRAQDLELSGFIKIEANDEFQVDITKSDTYLVRITADDNLFEHLEISKSGNTLHLGLRHNIVYKNTTQKATITLPSLRFLSIDGASRANISGFDSSESIDFYVSGAGHLNINDFKAGETRFQSSGAGQISGKINTKDIDFILSGGSNVELAGAGANMSVDASAGSKFTLSDFSAVNVDLHVSGGSQGYVNASDTISGDITGGSHIYYSGAPNLGKISVTGESIISNK